MCQRAFPNSITWEDYEKWVTQKAFRYQIEASSNLKVVWIKSQIKARNENSQNKSPRHTHKREIEKWRKEKASFRRVFSDGMVEEWEQRKINDLILCDSILYLDKRMFVLCNFMRYAFGILEQFNQRKKVINLSVHQFTKN